MTVTDTYNLGLHNWAELSTHVVQDMPIYAAVASSSRGPTSVDAEMLLTINAADDDVESDPGFVRNCGTMSAFVRE